MKLKIFGSNVVNVIRVYTVWHFLCSGAFVFRYICVNHSFVVFFYCLENNVLVLVEFFGLCGNLFQLHKDFFFKTF